MKFSHRSSKYPNHQTPQTLKFLCSFYLTLLTIFSLGLFLFLLRDLTLPHPLPITLIVLWSWFCFFEPKFCSRFSSYLALYFFLGTLTYILGFSSYLHGKTSWIHMFSSDLCPMLQKLHLVLWPGYSTAVPESHSPHLPPWFLPIYPLPHCQKCSQDIHADCYCHGSIVVALRSCSISIS